MLQCQIHPARPQHHSGTLHRDPSVPSAGDTTPRDPRSYEILRSTEPPWCVAPPTAAAGQPRAYHSIHDGDRAYHVWLARDRAYHV